MIQTCLHYNRSEKLLESFFYVNKVPISFGTCSSVYRATRWPCRRDVNNVCQEHSNEYSWVCDIPEDQSVSIKKLNNPYHLDDKEYHQFVASEIDILKYLSKYEKNNPNLTQYYGTIKSNTGHICIVGRKEFKTMLQILTERTLEFRVQFITAKMRHSKFLSVFAGILSGLYGLHSNGIIHRDLKPANIMFSHDGHIVIIDMGMSCWNYPSDKNKLRSQNGKDVVTAFYRAPEITQKKVYSFSIDIWSLAICMIDLALGQPVMYAYDKPKQFPSISDDILKVFKNHAILEVFTRNDNCSAHFKEAVKIAQKDSNISTVMYQSVFEETLHRAKLAKMCITDLIFSEHPQVAQEFLNVLEKMLDINPEKRPTSKELLKSDVLQQLAL